MIYECLQCGHPIGPIDQCPTVCPECGNQEPDEFMEVPEVVCKLCSAKTTADLTDHIPICKDCYNKLDAVHTVGDLEFQPLPKEPNDLSNEFPVRS